MNHQGQRWNVHYVANVGLRKRLNLCKRGFKIYDLLVFFFFVCDQTQTPTRPSVESRNFLLGSVLNNIVLVTPAMECSFHFGYVSTIVLTFLQVYFARSGSH